MKKNMIKVAFVAAFAMIAGYGAYSVQVSTDLSLSVLALDNVEALASGENDLCPNGCVSSGSQCYCNGFYPDFKEYGH